MNNQIILTDGVVLNDTMETRESVGLTCMSTTRDFTKFRTSWKFNIPCEPDSSKRITTSFVQPCIEKDNI